MGEVLTLSPSKEPTMSPAMPTPQPSTPPVAVPTSSPDTSNCGNTWAQCGGKDFEGGTCCKGSNICNFSNPWYSQCVPALITRLMGPPRFFEVFLAGFIFLAI